MTMTHWSFAHHVDQCGSSSHGIIVVIVDGKLNMFYILLLQAAYNQWASQFNVMSPGYTEVDATETTIPQSEE